MTKSEASYRLADSFIKEYRRFDYKIFSLKNIEQTKWWAFFEKAADYRNLENWTPELYIKCIFEKHGKVLPFRIVGKEAIAAFKEYSGKFLEKSSKPKMASEMLNAFKTIKSWSEKNNYNEIEYSKYFSNTNNQELVRRGNLSYYFLSICKPFIEKNKEIAMIENQDILEVKRMAVASNIKIYNKMKEFLKDNFYGGN